MISTPGDFKAINSLIEDLADTDFMLQVQELIDIYQDNWIYIIERELSNQFSLESQKDLNPLITRELNLMKRYINERAMLYKEPAKRTAYTDSVSKDDEGNALNVRVEDDVYNELMTDCELNTVMKTVNRLTCLTHHVLLRPTWRNGQFDFDILLFNNVKVLFDQDDWRKMVAVKYYSGLQLPQSRDSRGSASQTTVRIEKDYTRESGLQIFEYDTAWLWTLEDYEEKDELGTTTKKYKKGFVYKLRRDKNGQETVIEVTENPYKDNAGNAILPFVKFDSHYLYDSPFDWTTGNDLVDLTINVAVNLIHLNELMKYQAHLQAYFIAGDSSQLPDHIKASPRTIWKLGNPDGNTSAGTMDLQANIEAFLESILKRAETGLAQHGISVENFRNSGSAESGYHLYLKNRKLLEMRQDDIEIYRRKEKELFEIMRVVYNTHNPGKMIDVNAKFMIDFADITFPRSADEIANEKVQLISYNVETPIDWIKERNEDLDDVEAKKIYENNKAVNSADKASFLPSMQPADEEDEEEEDTEEEE